MYSTDKRRADPDNPIGVGRGFSQSPIGVDYDIVWDVATTKAGRLERDILRTTRPRVPDPRRTTVAPGRLFREQGFHGNTPHPREDGEAWPSQRFR